MSRNEFHHHFTTEDSATEAMTLHNTPDAQRVLHERAALLAQEATVEAQTESMEVVEFVLAGEHYAVETAFVREVFPLKELTPLPCTPAWMRGIVNVRSQILAVVDLKRFFNLSAGGISDLNKIIILQNPAGQEERTQFGVLVDQIVGTHVLPLATLQTEHQAVGIRRDYVQGITSQRLVVLNAQGILDDERLIVREEVVA